MRGRLLKAHVASGTRPTSDRVREAVFDMLQSIADLDGAVVLDLFAGTGAMGIEALSRGAARGTFVDSDPVARATIRANLDQLGLSSSDSHQVHVVAGDAIDYLRRAAVRPATEKAGHVAGSFDVAFLDPPYSFAAWAELLGLLDATWAVLESREPVEMPEGWVVARSRRYGGTLVTMASSARSTSGSGK